MESRSPASKVDLGDSAALPSVPSLRKPANLFGRESNNHGIHSVVAESQWAGSSVEKGTATGLALITRNLNYRRHPVNRLVPGGALRVLLRRGFNRRPAGRRVLASCTSQARLHFCKPSVRPEDGPPGGISIRDARPQDIADYPAVHFICTIDCGGVRAYTRLVSRDISLLWL